MRLEIVRDGLQRERERERERGEGGERVRLGLSGEKTSLCALYNLSDQLVFCVHIL
jgi:hypothetical protein